MLVKELISELQKLNAEKRILMNGIDYVTDVDCIESNLIHGEQVYIIYETLKEGE